MEETRVGTGPRREAPRRRCYFSRKRPRRWISFEKARFIEPFINVTGLPLSPYRHTHILRNNAGPHSSSVSPNVGEVRGQIQISVSLSR